MKIINFEKKELKLATKSNRNHMKMQKSIIFVEKNVKINIDKQNCKVIDHCHYIGEYRGVEHSICNLKYSVH